MSQTHLLESIKQGVLETVLSKAPAGCLAFVVREGQVDYVVKDRLERGSGAISEGMLKSLLMLVEANWKAVTNGMIVIDYAITHGELSVDIKIQNEL
ncbi:hypothetical protein [Paenibacillus sp. Y412MC10]|uniref:hypothetical protein n=1 Tax=Geobacillus sp. (strain Y412MC10) TaxID=481743 RepID=UPI0011AB47F1|nr:hypothetical protein [Paenibacillus sp. Y412MC10]